MLAGCGWVACHAAICRDLHGRVGEVIEVLRRTTELLISGSKVRVLDGPPINQGVPGHWSPLTIFGCASCARFVPEPVFIPPERTLSRRETAERRCSGARCAYRITIARE